MRRSQASSDLELLSGGGDMGALIRTHDWARTPLGPPETWSASLATALRILLDSGYPMYIAWGPEFVQIYNDAYRPILGTTKHPRALGTSTDETFSEIWDFIGPMFRRVRETGEPSTFRDQLLVLNRNGYPEECYFTFSYSAIRDVGRIGGVFVTVIETTDRVLRERRQDHVRRVTEALGGSARDLLKTTMSAASHNHLDLPFMVGIDCKTGHVAATDNIPNGSPLLEIERWPKAVARGITVLDLASDMQIRSEAWEEPIKQAALVPVFLPNSSEPSAVLISGINSRLAFEEEYKEYLSTVALRVATAFAESQALEAERKRAEQLAELDRAKTIFFSNISHELRTPLTLMLGPLENALAKAREVGDNRGSEDLRMAHRNAMRLLRLVNTLLDFSRIEAGRATARFEPTDLAALTADLASQFRSACDRAGLTLSIDCRAMPEPVFVDRELWEKIVLNLLSNAFKFTFSGGITVRLQRHGEAVEFEVVDTGIGIAQSDLVRIFDRFHRVEGARGRSFEGTGIGLALVQELVKLHGGSIAVESTPGTGTTFRIRLPLGKGHLPAASVTDESTVSPVSSRALGYVEEILSWLPGDSDRADSANLIHDASSDAGDAGSGRRVLVVDDNADMRGYLCRLLRSQNYEVEQAGDGVAALARAKRWKPHAILADIMMPRMDGFGLLKSLRSEGELCDIPVILLSARAGEESKVEGLEAGADDYLVKPFSARELFARTASVIALRDSQRQIAAAAQNENERIRRLFNQAPGFIAILRDADHRFEFANRAYERIVGGRALIGRTVREAFPELEGQGFFDLLDGVYRTGERFIGTAMPVRLARNPDGALDQRYIDFVYEPVLDNFGKPIGIFVEGYDVTDRVVAEAALRDSEERFRTLADNISTLCWMARPDGHIFWYNSRWYEYTGTSPLDQVGWGWQAVHDPNTLPAVMERWNHSLATGESFEMTFPLRGGDGRLRPFLTRIVPLKDHRGNVVRWFGTNTDVTTQHNHEEQLRLLINELNHRVKNTLALVQSVATQSLKGAADLTSARNNLDARLIAMSGAHDLLTQQTWQGAWIADVLNGALSSFVQEPKRVSLSGSRVWIAPRMALSLSMALHELATNATKYGALSNESGSIAVSWNIAPQDQNVLQIRWSESGGPVVARPSRRGFGSRLIEQVLAADLEGKVELQFRAEGVICHIEAPLGDAEEQPV